jgi:hypothetical protein
MTHAPVAEVASDTPMEIQDADIVPRVNAIEDLRTIAPSRDGRRRRALTPQHQHDDDDQHDCDNDCQCGHMVLR